MPKPPSPTPADVHGYWPGSSVQRHRRRGSALALVALVVAVGAVWVANRAGSPSVAQPAVLPPSRVSSAPPAAQPRNAFVDANELTRMSNDRVAAINQADAGFMASPRSAGDQRKEFVAFSVADTAFQNWLVAATFPSAASDDVRALLTAVNRLLSSEFLVTSSTSDASAEEGFKQFLDANASEEAAELLLRKQLS
jgi:hypothetical protein